MSLLPVLGLEDQKNTFRANIDIVRPLDDSLKLEGNNNNNNTRKCEVDLYDTESFAMQNIELIN